MLKIDRIGVNFHMLKGGARTRLVDGRGDVFFSWGAISDRENARQSACRVRAGEWDSGWIQQEQNVDSIRRRPAAGGRAD